MAGWVWPRTRSRSARVSSSSGMASSSCPRSDAAVRRGRRGAVSAMNVRGWSASTTTHCTRARAASRQPQRAARHVLQRRFRLRRSRSVGADQHARQAEHQASGQPPARTGDSQCGTSTASGAVVAAVFDGRYSGGRRAVKRRRYPATPDTSERFLPPARRPAPHPYRCPALPRDLSRHLVRRGAVLR